MPHIPFLSLVKLLFLLQHMIKHCQRGTRSPQKEIDYISNHILISVYTLCGRLTKGWQAVSGGQKDRRFRQHTMGQRHPQAIY